jgi:hypothetical protein
MAKAQTATPRKSRLTKASDAAAIKANLEVSSDQHVITEEQAAADAAANNTLKADAFAHFVANATAPAAPLETPPAKREEFEAKMKALAAEYNVNVDVKVKAPKADKKMSNGVVRPGESTLCGKIWATADAISAATHGICAVAALKAHPAMHGVNDHTVKTQYSKWRAFNGVVGRLPKLHAVHQREGEYDGIPLAEPKAPETQDSIGGA